MTEKTTKKTPKKTQPKQDKLVKIKVLSSDGIVGKAPIDEPSESVIMTDEEQSNPEEQENQDTPELTRLETDIVDMIGVLFNVEKPEPQDFRMAREVIEKVRAYDFESTDGVENSLFSKIPESITPADAQVPGDRFLIEWNGQNWVEIIGFSEDADETNDTPESDPEETDETRTVHTPELIDSTIRLLNKIGTENAGQIAPGDMQIACDIGDIKLPGDKKKFIQAILTFSNTPKNKHSLSDLNRSAGVAICGFREQDLFSLSGLDAVAGAVETVLDGQADAHPDQGALDLDVGTDDDIEDSAADYEEGEIPSQKKTTSYCTNCGVLVATGVIECVTCANFDRKVGSDGSEESML